MKKVSQCCGSKLINYPDLGSSYYCTECLMVSKPKKSYKNLFISFLVVLGVFTSLGLQKPIEPLKQGQIKEKQVVQEFILNDSNLTIELVKNSCLLANIAVCQARLESGNYTSTICKENFNLFGIKWHPRCKYVIGEKNNHAAYKSYKDNIACYCHIQRKYLKNIEFKYAEDSCYITTLKSM